MSEVDNQGRCSKHPFVQIKRRSRQGEWKALLDSCPLCAIDYGHEDCSSSNHSISENEELSSDALVPADSGVQTRRTSKVKFASEDESLEKNPYVVSLLPASLLSPISFDSSISEHGSGQSVASNTGSIASTRSALKLSKYKVCEMKMQQHLNETENVTTMSMDLDIDEDSDDDEEEEEEEPIQQRSTPVTQPRQPQPQPVEEEPIFQEPRRKHHGESRRSESRRKEKKRNKRPQIRSSLVQVSPDMIRPDPEEFPCGESLGSYHQEMPRPLPPPLSSGPYTNVVYCPPTNFDDEVSAISFMESVKHQPIQYSHKSRQQQDPITEESENFQESNECINTNNYDHKGRCVNHPQIRLRKKKIFGRGWKVLMNACPDCCVDELRRFKSAEVSKRRQLRSEHQYQGGGSVRSAPLPLPLSHHSIKSISDETASLTTSNDSSSSDRSAKNSRQERHHIVPAAGSNEKEVIFVRQMQWEVDRGNTGLYTGEVNSEFTPHGTGSLVHNDGTVTEGEWRRGEYRPKRRSRSNSRSRSTRSRSQSKTRVSSSSGRSRSSSRSSVTRTRSRSMSVQAVERTRSTSVQPVARY